MPLKAPRQARRRRTLTGVAILQAPTSELERVAASMAVNDGLTWLTLGAQLRSRYVRLSAVAIDTINTLRAAKP